MIRELRKKFILVAMLSTLVVLAAIMSVVNISNYKELLARADEMTSLLAKNDGKFPEGNGQKPDEGDKKRPHRKNQRRKNIFQQKHRLRRDILL